MVQMIHDKSEKNLEYIRRKDRGSMKHNDIDSNKTNELIKKNWESRKERGERIDRHMKEF